MTMRTRKLVGTVLTVVFLIIYSLAAMVISDLAVSQLSGLWQALYFVVAGFAWLPAAMLLVRWMQRPDA